MHRCSDNEFARFYSAENENDAKLVSNLQADGHFYCVDWRNLPDEFNGYWKSNTDNFSFYEAMLVPCVSTEDDDCILGEQEVKDYVSDFWNMLVYHNQFRFEADAYGD